MRCWLWVNNLGGQRENFTEIWNSDDGIQSDKFAELRGDDLSSPHISLHGYAFDDVKFESLL